jgi:hypothetical protein
MWPSEGDSNMRRRLLASLAAVALVSLWIGVAPPAVVAECFPRPPAGSPIPIAYAFTATVVDLSTEVDQEAKDAGEGDGLVWHMELQVDDVHRGSVPARLSLTGYTLWHRSCSDFLGEQTHVGERLFVAIDDQVKLESNPSLFGQLLLWHRVNDRWSFNRGALKDEPEGPASYPNAALEAHTTQQILAAIESVAAPNTAIEPDVTSEPRQSSEAVPWIWAIAAFAITFLAYMRGYIGPRSRMGGDSH